MAGLRYAPPSGHGWTNIGSGIVFGGRPNVTGTKRLLALAKTSGVRRFVFFSSGGAIYGDTPSPANEQQMPAPRSHYGVHKLAAEEFVRAAGLSYAILRPSNVYGLRQRADAEGGVVAIFRERLLTGDPLEIHGRGQQVRDFVHVSDVTSAVVAALTTEDDVTWNVASGTAVSVLNLARTMAAVAGRSADMRYGPSRAGDVDQSLLSVGALLSTGRWGPPLPLRDGLRLMMPDLTYAATAGPLIRATALAGA